MEGQAKKPVHITWQEAVRAEAERDKARQARCRSLPPSRMKVITEDISRDLPKLKASALRLWDVNFNHRLRTWTATVRANFRAATNRHEVQAEECQRGQFGSDLFQARPNKIGHDIGHGNSPGDHFTGRGRDDGLLAAE